jgi:L-ascorbate metabolism protein UlaG (beta-lactamase superfamily)
MNAAVAIPIHFGDIVGSRKDAEKFRGMVKTKVQILDQGEAYTLA